MNLCQCDDCKNQADITQYIKQKPSGFTFVYLTPDNDKPEGYEEYLKMCRFCFCRDIMGTKMK